MKNLIFLSLSVTTLVLCSFTISSDYTVRKIEKQLYEVQGDVPYKSDDAEVLKGIIAKHYKIENLDQIEEIEFDFITDADAKTKAGGDKTPQKPASWILKKKAALSVVKEKLIKYYDLGAPENEETVSKIDAILAKYVNAK